MRLENSYKSKVLIPKIKQMFPYAIVTHLNPLEIQGIPDILILNGPRWATLEGKKSENEPYRPNQEYYINLMNQMSFSRMICPENEMEVLYELQQALTFEGEACILKRI